MTPSFSVLEKYSKHWPAVVIVSAIGAILTGAGYLISDDVLLSGYLKLASFAFFAICLLSAFKLRDGQMEMKYIIEDGLLSVEYHLKNRKIGVESFELSDFNDLKITQPPNRSLYNDLFRTDRCLQVNRKDSGWIYLNEVNGRIIPLNNDNAKRVYSHLEPHIKTK